MEQAENILFTIAMAGYFLAMLLYFVFAGLKKNAAAKAASLIQTGGLVAHTAALIVRGIAAGRVPMTNQYEFATCFAWALCLVSLIFIAKYRFSFLGVFAAPVVFLIMGYAAMQSREIHALMPALQSNWLVFHVSTAILSYGAFGVSFVLGFIFLVREKIRKDGFMDQHIPDRDKLDVIEYRSVCLGLLFLTITIITGAFWAKKCWGSYWNWDPKETWSLVTWIIYAVYLHLRLRSRRKGTFMAWYLVIAVPVVFFTFAGVNTFMHGLHTYG
jgi:cytochrome c-type biogenesis protein CcsB